MSQNDSINQVFADTKRLHEAWQAVRRADGAAGVDRISIDEYHRDATVSLESIRQRLIADKYRFSKLRYAVVPKASGGERKLGIPTVSDRIVLQSMRLALEPDFEKVMLPCSHAYRQERGSQTALADIRIGLQDRLVYVVETDIRNFFDNIRHRPLLVQMTRVEPRMRTCRLLRDAMSMSAGLFPARKGIAQGSPLSPLLANISLMEFDRMICSPSTRMVRYADDLVVLCQTQSEADRAYQHIAKELSKIGLEMHPDKTRIVDSRRESFSFVGFEIHPDRIVPSSSNVSELKSSILGWCNPNLEENWPTRIERINGLLRSFAWYYHQTDSGRLFMGLDQFAREQLDTLQAVVKPAPNGWEDQLVRIGTIRDVVWKGSKKRKGWNGYGK
jgi:RNA-directed DNA polymerase